MGAEAGLLLGTLEITAFPTINTSIPLRKSIQFADFKTCTDILEIVRNRIEGNNSGTTNSSNSAAAVVGNNVDSNTNAVAAAVPVSNNTNEFAESVNTTACTANQVNTSNSTKTSIVATTVDTVRIANSSSSVTPNKITPSDMMKTRSATKAALVPSITTAEPVVINVKSPKSQCTADVSKKDKSPVNTTRSMLQQNLMCALSKIPKAQSVEEESKISAAVAPIGDVAVVVSVPVTVTELPIHLKKYQTMLKAGVPESAVTHKMKMEVYYATYIFI